MTDGYQGGRHAAGAIPWLFGGALIVVAVFGIAFAVLLTGNSNPTGPSHNHKPQALAAASQPTDTTPAQSASPSPSAHKPAHKSSPASSSPPPSATSQPPSSAPPPSNRAATVHLTATVSVSSHGSSGSGIVAFQVKDTGSAASGQVIVTITLPAGASMSSGWGGGGGGGGGDVAQSPSDWSYGWSCQATSTGATCTHDGIAAGNQAWGAVGFTVNSGSVCGQPVDLTARSGSASAGAQSTVAC